MASATNGAPPMNPTTGNTHSPASIPKDVPSRQARPANAKMNDKGRKESPADSGKRPQPKAWTGGANPLTQKVNSSTHANGNTPQARPGVNARATTQKEGGLSDRHSHDRLCFLLGGAIGLTVVFTTKSGERFEGILAGSSLAANNAKLTLQMTKKLQGSGLQINGIALQEAALVGTSPNYTMNFDLREMADLSISYFSLPETSRPANGASSSFRTDADISANAGRGAERILRPWVPDGPDTTEFSLESGGIGGWDQFAAHKEKFGDNSTYDENLYTTTINRSAPDFARKEADARKMANEISSEVSNIAHVREERGQAVQDDNDDEEDKYSGVRREDRTFAPLQMGGSNKYTPPARRAPTAQPTVSGAPVDSAIVSARISKPEGPQSSVVKPSFIPGESTEVLASSQITEQTTPITKDAGDVTFKTEPQKSVPASDEVEPSGKSHRTNADATIPPKSGADNPTEDVENKVLDQFRHFANIERQRFADRKRAQATQDRTAKLNDLLRFSKTFKLKTPIPNDLVGILAKDPAKQEAIQQKAQKEHEDFKSGPPTPSANVNASSKATPTSSRPPTVPKFDASQIPPPIPARDTFNRGRGGFQQHGVRNDRSGPQVFPGRAVPTFGQRIQGQQDRKASIPAPIGLEGGRIPPTGPMADQIPSPHRSNIHTPTSAVSTRFNVKATEFRPNVNAPTFNPSAASNVSSSPASVQRTTSISRTASPSSFFGPRRPKAGSERVKVLELFNPVDRTRKEIERRKAEKREDNVKDYPTNGGIPNAYHTAPTWTVKDENIDRKYTDTFNRPGLFSPNQSRTPSSQHLPYQGQMMGANGVHHTSTPQHGPPSSYGHHFDEHRMPMQGPSPQVYPSPGMSIRQMSNFSSPLPHQAQLAFAQQQFYGVPGAQMAMQMRQFPTTPSMMHAQPGQMAAPMMAQQPSNGPYMAVPQQYSQMQMYSPNAGHVYPQQNGYPSPGRMAPMMVHQNSQQSHHGGQPMMYGLSGQGGPMIYPNQQGQAMPMRPAYGVPPGQYGSSPQPPHMQQRAMSSGYTQRNTPQNASQGQNQGPPANAPQQPAAFGQMDMVADDNK